MKINNLPDTSLLRVLFDYNPETGSVIRRVGVARNGHYGTRAGAEVGHLENGYKRVVIKNKKYQLHRVCWAIFHGDCSEDLVIDHINRNRSDNRIKNLRLVTNRENTTNCRISKNNTSGYSGVHYATGKGKWRATIWNNGKLESLGSFGFKEDAIQARKKAERDYLYLSSRSS